MQVFKSMFKVLRGKSAVVLIYLVAFTVLAAVLSFTGGNPVGQMFEETRFRLAVFDEDGSALSEALTGYLAEKNELVEIENDAQAKEDALFFRSAEYLLTIPAGFAERFYGGEESLLTHSALPDSNADFAVTAVIDRYLKAVTAYRNNTALSETEILKKAAEDLSAETQVTVTKPQDAQAFAPAANFYNWQVYCMICIIGFSIVTLLQTFQEKNVRMRGNCGFVRPSRVNAQRYLFYFLLSLAFFGLEVLASFAFCGATMFTAAGGFAVLNLLTLTLVYLGLAIFIGSFRLTDLGINAVINVVGLGMSFISGAFVPQSLLSEGVVIASRFLPASWYVTNNNLLASSVVTSQLAGTLLANMGIMLVFGAVFLAGSVLVNRIKRTAR